jgi:hypothetical protein
MTYGPESRTMEIILLELRASRRHVMVTGKVQVSHYKYPVQVETSGYNSCHIGRNLKQLFPREFV